MVQYHPGGVFSEFWDTVLMTDSCIHLSTMHGLCGMEGYYDAQVRVQDKSMCSRYWSHVTMISSA